MFANRSTSWTIRMWRLYLLLKVLNTYSSFHAVESFKLSKIAIHKDVIISTGSHLMERKHYNNYSNKRRKSLSMQDSPFAPYFALNRPFSGLITDFRRRTPYYKKDWSDGITKWKKSFAAILFLYFACLAPTVAFGGLTNLITEGTMGVIEFILSCGIGGMFYAVFSGQPMTFLGN